MSLVSRVDNGVMRLRHPTLPRPALFRVRGLSMAPTVADGDLLLAWRGTRPRAGELAVIVLPPGASAPGRLAVKRVVGPAPRGDRGWWVERDNPRAGADSWSFGAVPGDHILAGRVVRLPRAGRWVADLDAFGEVSG